MLIYHKKLKKTFVTSAIFFAFSFGFFIFPVQAAEVIPKVDYKGEIIVDSDLDGLTDQGEIQIYKTNPGSADTDEDGFLDGAEILSDTNPLDSDSPARDTAVTFSLANFNQPTPWAWYIGRASGIIGFIFLWLTVFLGLSIRNPIFKKIVAPIYSFDFHCFLAAVAVFLALIHGTSFIFDQTAQFTWKDSFIPFFSQTSLVDPNFLALGIMAFYAMVIITITSYLRKHLNHIVWRFLHFLNPIAFIFVVVHGYFNGTDMKNFWIGMAFLISSYFLVIVYLSSLFFIITKRKTPPTEPDPNPASEPEQVTYSFPEENKRNRIV
jgi:DMSO/TMAO reductase YedYZ heme-binding membrane subunit